MIPEIRNLGPWSLFLIITQKSSFLPFTLSFLVPVSLFPLILFRYPGVQFLTPIEVILDMYSYGVMNRPPVCLLTIVYTGNLKRKPPILAVDKCSVLW